MVFSDKQMEGDELQAYAQARCGSTIADAYLLERLIGIGGMGAVYDASAMNGSRVAVKVLHRFVSSVPGTRERFRDEALVARRIQHPGVVRIYDDGVARDGDLYLVMELLQGQAIDERMMNAGGALPMNEVLPIAASALETLHAAHEAGVIHRDLKPENLFLTTSRTLKVLDFGIAKLSGPDRLVKRTRTGVVMGTPAFMAPEQARTSLGEVDRRTDIWAMGAVMFTALTGRPVHPGEDVGEVLGAAAMKPAVSLARVVQAPLPLVRVVDRALSFDKAERYETAAAMREAIREAIVEMREGTRPATFAPPAASPQSATAHLQTLVENDAGGGDGNNPFAVPPPSDEDRAALVEHFSLLEKMLLAVQQYGLAHPETSNRLAVAVQYAVDAINRTGRPLAWNITPYSFVAGGNTLWEPRSPYERIPYQLFADGIRVIVLLPGVTALELDGFIRLIMRDRFREMAPEDDFVTMLWESDFDHIAHQAIDSFGDGDLTRRSRFENDVRDVEQLGRTPPGVIAQCWLQRGSDAAGANSPTPQAHGQRIRRILDGTGAIDAGAIASAESMLSGAHRSPMPDKALQLSEDMVRVLSAKLDGDAAQVEPKFARSIGLAWVEARATGALEVVASRLRTAIDASALVRPEGALATLAELGAVVAQKQPDFIRAVLSEQALTAVLNVPNPELIKRLLGYLDVKSVPRIVDAALKLDEGPPKEALLGYLARPDLDYSKELSEHVAAADEARSLAMFRLVLRVTTPAAKTTIGYAMTSPHAVVRIEAIGHLEGPSSEKLRLELKSLLEAEDPMQRMAALATIAQNAVRVAGPTLVLRIRSPKFDALPPDEKAAALRTLATLAPRRAEEVCIELVGNAGLVPLEAREQTRIAAAELLAEIATTPAASEALQAAASSRWRSGEKLREIAKNGAQRLSMPPASRPSLGPPSSPSIPPRSKP